MSEPMTFEPAAPMHVLLAKLGKAHAPNGMTAMGERLAMVVVSKTQAELRQIAENLEVNAPKAITPATRW